MNVFERRTIKHFTENNKKAMLAAEVMGVDLLPKPGSVGEN